MPEPTQDPEVAQVLSAIQQLMLTGRTPSRPPPLVLTPELRVDTGKPDPVRPVNGSAQAADRKPEGLAAAADGRATPLDAGPERSATLPASSSPKANGSAGTLLLERPLPPAADASERPAPSTLPLLILGTADLDGSGSAALRAPASLQPFLLQHPLPPVADPVGAVPTTAPTSAPASDVTQDLATASSAPLPEPDNAVDPVGAPSLTGEDVPVPASAIEPDGPAASDTAVPSRPAEPALMPLPDLSAFLPLAGLPPSIALLERGRATPSAAQDPAPEDPPFASAPEEPASWAGPDWPELAPADGSSDPAALPDDDVSALLAETGDAAEPVLASDPDDGLRDRVVVIVREEIKREVGDLREVVRQEVRDVLTERERP